MIELRVLKPLVILIAGLSAGTALANGVEINPVLKTTTAWDGSVLSGCSNGQMQTTVLTYKIAPGEKTPLHIHPVNGSGFILSGELTMYATTDPHGSFADPALVKEVTLKKGQAWGEAVNTWHYGENKSDKEVTFIVMFSGTENTPVTLSDK